MKRSLGIWIAALGTTGGALHRAFVVVGGSTGLISFVMRRTNAA
jgi:hypothetical protein